MGEKAAKRRFFTLFRVCGSEWLRFWRGLWYTVGRESYHHVPPFWARARKGKVVFMDEKEYKASEGSCVISEEVIASIASSAALEVPGVAGMAQKPADLRGLIGSPAARAVRVINNENETVLDVYINIQLGVRIPDVAPAVQHSVKVAVQSMTGKPVNKVNVHIAGIILEENKEALVK